MKKAIDCLALVAFLAVALSAAAAQQGFPTVSTVDAKTIAGRPVELDSAGKLLPWPMPDDTGYSYAGYFLSQWTIVDDQFNRDRLQYYYCCFDFDRTTYELYPDLHWANSTGYLRAMMQGFMERLYPYTGDPRTLEFIENFVDYELENGRTPAGYAWAEVPYPSANPGSKRYTGWSQHGEDFVEPHVVGEDGYAYLRLYEMTGNTRYLRAAIQCAEALAKNFKPGDADHSPWPYRCFARDGRVEGGKGMFDYSANVVEPIMLFDELIRLGQGNTASYKSVRAGAWTWLMKYPMQNNKWVGYFEDVQATMDNMNQVIPLELARYVLLHPELDKDWKQHSADLIDWVKTTPRWPKYIVHGATVTTEQGDGRQFCCNLPNQCCDSHSARLAAVEAFYYAKTGDLAYKQQAFRTFNWVTYFQGLPGEAHAPFGNQWWFTDEFSDGPRRVMDAFWAVPEWAPAGESHLLGSISAVTRIEYSAGRVTYSTFDEASDDVLRLDFTPASVMAGGKPLAHRKDLAAEGYIFDETTHVLRIHHSSSRDIDIQGTEGNQHFAYVTFDNPHLAAGTHLAGQYPAGVIEWNHDSWAVGTPGGKFGTFNLIRADAHADETGFRFAIPLIFAGIDVYNGADHEATVRVRSPENREVSVTLKPKQLVRLRTDWRDVSSAVWVSTSGGEELRFDNLAYLRP